MYRPTLPAALYNDTGWFFQNRKVDKSSETNNKGHYWCL